jgi:hypothetical protein
LSKEGQPGRDQSNASSKEQGGTPKESAGSTPRASLTQEQQGWHEKQHEELVKAIRGFIKQREQESQLRLSPEKRISLELFGQTNASSENKGKISKERDQFFSRLKVA